MRMTSFYIFMCGLIAADAGMIAKSYPLFLLILSSCIALLAPVFIVIEEVTKVDK